MVTRDDIIRQLVETHFVENYARQLCGKADMVYFDDIVGELYLILCELPERRLRKMYRDGGIGAVRQFMSGVITRQLRSTTSLCYQRYTLHVYTEIATENPTWTTDPERQEDETE